MIKEIQYTIICQPNIVAAYGFGSFFRHEQYNDIDILLVLKGNRLDLLDTYYSVKHSLKEALLLYKIEPDIICFTEREFNEKPLREMDHLTPILNRHGNKQK